MIGSVRKPIDAFFGWLNAPVANAAGRLGLFRIVYGLFYLWYLATQSPGMIGITPNSFYEWPITILQGWPMPPSVAFIENIESLLAGCLVLLTIGCWTRTMNVLVLDPRTVCVEKSEVYQAEQMDKLGMEVLEVELRDAYAFGGGLHCCTADVYREGDLEDYFPKQ